MDWILAALIGGYACYVLLSKKKSGCCGDCSKCSSCCQSKKEETPL